MSREKALSLIRKNHKNILRDDFAEAHMIDAIPTGSLIIDKVIGIGGIPKGRITEIIGEFSTGKTTLALSVAANAQRQGLHVTYFDYEHALSATYAKRIGVDLSEDKFLLLQPDTLEEGADIIFTLLEERATELIVIDSIAAMTPKEAWEKSAEKSLTLGAQARGINQFLVKATKLLNESGTTLIAVNQTMTKIGTMPGAPTEDTKGGKALKFYKSVALQFKLLKKGTATAVSEITQQKELVNLYSKIQVRNTKNKVSEPYRSGELYIRYGYGFDNYLSVLEVGEKLGLVKKVGLNLTYAGTSIGKGLNKAAINLSKPEMREIYEDLVSNLKWDQVSIVTDLSDVDLDEDDSEE